MDMPNEKRKRRLDRRSFLRNSGLAAGGAAGMTAMAPFASAITRTADPSRSGARDDSMGGVVLGGEREEPH
jgi:hypothetical protein